MTNGSSSGTLGCPTTNISSRLGEVADGPGAGRAAEGAGCSRPTAHGFPPLAASSSCSAAAPPPCASVLSPPARMTCCWLAVREVAAAGMFGSISPRSRGEVAGDAWKAWPPSWVSWVYVDPGHITVLLGLPWKLCSGAVLLVTTSQTTA